MASAKPAAKGKKRKKAVFPPEILAEVPQPSQWHSADQSKHHKQKLSKYRYVTKADKRKVANGPQYAAKIFVFNEGIPIGHYETEEEAAKQADIAVLFYRHKYPNSGKLWLNFPLSTYPLAVRNGQVLPDAPLVKDVYGDSFVKAGALRRDKAEASKTDESEGSGSGGGSSGGGGGGTPGMLKGSARHVGKTGVVRGAGRFKGRFGAYISLKNKRIDLGYSNTPEEAARVYDIASLRYRGPHAPLNYPRAQYSYQQVYARALAGSWNDGRTVANAQSQMFALVDAELEACERRHYWELMDWKMRADKSEKALAAAQKKIARLETSAAKEGSSSSSPSKKSAVAVAVPAVQKQRATVTASVASDVGRGWFFSNNYKKEMAGVPSKKRRKVSADRKAEIGKYHQSIAGYVVANESAAVAAPAPAAASSSFSASVSASSAPATPFDSSTSHAV